MNDTEDAQFQDNGVLTRTGTLTGGTSVSGKLIRSQVSGTGYLGSGAAIVADDYPLSPVLVIIYDGLPTSELVPFQVTISSAIEVVLSPAQQF